MTLTLKVIKVSRKVMAKRLLQYLDCIMMDNTVGGKFVAVTGAPPNLWKIKGKKLLY
jgi:hypothetical protein